ncbi:transcription factor TFIIIB component B'' homolog [Myxocyprinus asiaticus]|uniref:transcription factor TFIIIB component B'' homolog n=1 Tax=Myxocyprinus asiaticus TaxID=70543 RepID=UPI0022224EA3|nr:transcription factor TFIIIB component B'' homolog [Myxocyprinus asiaticus]
MRRSRISIKPNVRPGGRSVAPTAESKSSQEPTAVHNTQQAQIGEEIDRPSTAPQPRLEVIEPDVATGDRNVPGSPSEKASVNTSDGVPSSASTPATTALQRRSRISATPNLARPKIRSVPPLSTGTTASLPSVPSKSLPEASVPVATSGDDSPNTTFSDPINSQTTATAHCPPSSPSLPSTSGCHEPSVRKTSVPESPFTQSQQETPKQIQNKDSVPQEGASPVLPYVKLACCDEPGSPLKNSEMTSDKQRVLKALKLKELMKLERRKERMVGKKRQKREHSDEMDRRKMTIADFIYYLPQSNPMRSSLSTEEVQEKTIVPPSPKVLEKMAEPDEEDDDAEEELLVPKVKVAEDGSLILDDNSLTVRVQRTSDTVVENANPLFERGSTTTYASFRKKCFVKNWSIRETDMFYLAISMVGTDFSLIAQLLTHRSRAEIKRKFRKEDKTNSWRVDQAFRNKRPYDKEFFSFLLKRILAKDKERGKSIKLVVKKAKKGKGSNKAKELEDEDMINDNDDDDDLYIGESGSLDLEKENEDSSNVKVADVPLKTSKKRKRTREPEVSTRKPRKNNKKSKKGKCLVEESELLNVEDDILEGDSVNAENKDTSCTSIPAKKRKRSKKGDKKRQEEEPEEKCKTKKKKTLKVPTDVDREPTHDDGEGDEINEEHKSDVSTKKRKRCKKLEKEKYEPTKGKLKTKKTKMSKEDSVEVELGADSSEVSTAGPGGEEDQGEKLIQKTAAQEEIPQNSSKRLKKPNLATRKAKKCSEATVEVEDTTQETRDENCKEAEIENRIGCLDDKPLHKQAVVILERTPPRLKNAESSSQGKDQPQSPQSLQASPGRQTRAEKVKRNLNAPKSMIKEKGKIDEHQDGSGSDTSPEEMSSTAMPYQVVIQKCKEMEAVQSTKEGVDLSDLEFLPSSEVHGRTLLKKLVVLVSHEEVEHYLRVQAQPDATSAKVDYVEEQGDGPEEKGSSSVTLKERDSQDPEEKDSDSASDSAQQCNAQKRNPPSSKYDSSQQKCSSSVEDKVKTVPNEDLVEQHRESPEEKSSITQEENSFQDVKDDTQTSTDVFPSFPSDEETPPWESKKVVQEILSFLDEPQVPPTTSSDKDTNEKDKQPGSFLTSENKDQITDQEESKSERNETELQETLTEEPQKELKRTIPISCSERSADDASVTTQQYIAPERRSWFAKPKPNLRRASKVTINPQQAIKPNKGSTSETGCQNPAKAQHCELDLNIKTISREDELVSSDVNLREQAEDLLSSVPSLNSTKTLDPKVPVDNSGTGNEERIDNQTNKEPTFILTLYEIPASQLLLEATSGPQDTDPYELEPAQVQTPLLCSGKSLSLPSTLEASCCTVPHMGSEEIEKPCKSVSQKGEDDSLIPVAANAVKDDITQSQESSSPLESQEVLSSNDAMKPTDVTNVSKLDPRPTESTEAKPPAQRRSKIKVRPKLRPCVKVGPSNTNQSECESSQPTTSKDNLHGGHEGVLSNATVPDPEEGRDKVHRKKESPPKTGLQMGFPLGEESIESSVSPRPFSAEADHVVDTANIPGQHSSVIKDVEDSCEGVSHIVLDDALVLAFGEMEDDDMGMASFHERKLHKFEDVSVCHPESKRLLSADNDQMVEVTDISKKVDTCGEASAVTPSATQEMKMPFRRSKLQVKPKLAKAAHTKDGSSRKVRSKIELIHPATSPIISPVPQQVIEHQIKEKTDKVEQRSEQEDICDMVPTVTNEVVKVKQPLIQFTTAKTSICAESPPVEEKSEDWHKDVPHTVLPDIIVPVSEEMEDEVHKESGISLQSGFQSSEDPYICAVESQQSLIAEADEEIDDEHEGVSHMVLTDIFIPVSEESGDDLTKEWTTTGKGSPHKAERSQLKKHPDISNLRCAESNLRSSNSPKRKTPMRKGTLKVKMIFPKTKESSKSVQQSQTALSVPSTLMVKQQDIDLTLNSLENEHVSQSKVESNSEDGKCSIKDLTPFASKDLQPWQQSTHCSVKETLTCADPEKTFEGVSHTVLYDVLVPVFDETAESCLHKEGFLVGLQDSMETPSQDVVKVVKPTDIERPSNTERVESTASRSVSVERKAPSCRGATPQQSLEPQAEEWSLKSDMLPMDSDELDNWCEGVSHMLLSDAFVPVSEMIADENSTDWKACVARSPKKDKEYALSPPESKETSLEKTNEVHQSGSISQMPKMVINSSERLLASQAITSPGRGTFHMTLRSPQRTYPKDQPDLLKSTQAVPTTPQRANASNLKESVRTPTKQQTEEITNVCRVQLERLTSEQICLSQNYLEPRHHSTPVNVKTTSRGSGEMHKAFLPLHGSTSTGLESCADEEPPVPSGNWPKVVINRMEIKATDADTSMPTASPARVSAAASQKLSEHQSPHSSPLNSGLDDDEEPGQVSQFFLDDIFTEVDPD